MRKVKGTGKISYIRRHGLILTASWRAKFRSLKPYGFLEQVSALGEDSIAGVADRYISSSRIALRPDAH